MLRLVEAPSDGPVSLVDAKKHCRANDFTDDDDVLEIYLDAATRFVAARCSLVLSPSLYLLELSGWWAGRLDIQVAPVRDISIKYSDALGAEQMVEDSEFRWERTPDGAALDLLPAFARPTVLFDRRDAVRVEISAGFDAPDDTGSGDDPELKADPRARQSILLLTSHWYENREAVSQGAPVTVPLAAESLMAQLRIYR